MPGPTAKLSHDQCRFKVCAVCYCRSGMKATKKVSDSQEIVIKDLVFSGYDKSETRFPAGLCLTCFFVVNDNMDGVNKSTKSGPPRKFIQVSPEVYENKVQTFTRSNLSVNCQCSICLVARLNGPSWSMFLFEIKKKSKPSSDHGVRYDRLCPKCFFPIYRGSNHSRLNCDSRVQSSVNVRDAIQKSNASMDHLACEHIKDKAQESSSSSRTVRLKSQTGGH